MVLPRHQPLSVEGHRADGERHLARDCPRRPSGHPGTCGENGSETPPESPAQLGVPPVAPSSPTRRRWPVAYINPAHTSQTCSQCGHSEKANRQSQSKFLCRSCGFSAHADLNAALTLRAGRLSYRQTRRPSRGSCKPPDFSPCGLSHCGYLLIRIDNTSGTVVWSML
jgi:hypothetical protein